MSKGSLRVVLATANPHKVDEMAAVLGEEVELLARPADLPEVEEDADTLEANARLKAEAIAAATGLPALADDTGLEVDALGGRPGVHSARYAGPEADPAANRARLLAELAQRRAVTPTDRRAVFRTVMLLRWPNGDEVLGRGEVAGHIAAQERGDGGFGYDPLFVPDDGDGRTFAEMPADEKNAISHRARALGDLVRRLASGDG